MLEYLTETQLTNYNCHPDNQTGTMFTIEDMLNNRAKEGWRLVGIVPQFNAINVNLFILEREKKENGQ